MNTLRQIFLIVAISLGTVCIQAQDSLYREALKEYFNIRPSDLVDIDVKKATSEINNRALLGFDQNKLDSLLKRYHDEQLQDDFLDFLLMPAFKGIVSFEDLKELTALMQTPEGQLFQEHEVALKMKIKKEGRELISSATSSAFKALQRGDRLEDVKPDKNIPKEYRKKYFESTDTALISSLMAPLHNLLLKKDDSDDKSRLAAVLEHQRKNLATILLNLSYGIMTEDDLDFQKLWYSLKAQQHFVTAIRKTLNNITEYSQQWMFSYAQWLDKQPEVNDFYLQMIADYSNVRPDAEKEDMKGSFVLEEGCFVQLMTIDDSHTDEVKNELKQYRGNVRIAMSILESFNDSENKDAVLKCLQKSKRNFVLRIVGKPSGEIIEDVVDHSTIDHHVSNIEAWKKAIMGKALKKDGKYAEALPLLKAGAEAGFVDAQYELGGIYCWIKEMKNTEEALKWYEKVATQDGDKTLKADALNEIAYLYSYRQQFDKAISSIDQAIETLPDEPNYYDSKGEILFMKGDKKGAKAMWQKVVSLDPKFAETHDSNLYILLYGMKSK